MGRLWMLNRAWIVFIAFLGVGVPLFGGCGVPQPRLVRAEYSQSEAVVTARVVKSEYFNPVNTEAYHLYTFEVETTLRGKIPKHFVLWNENSSASLTFDIRQGRRYLLFVDRIQEKGWWTADGCGHSGDLAKRQGTLRTIRQLRTLQSGLVTGTVIHLPDDLRATVVVTRKMDGKQFDSQVSGGSFSIEVPPGGYSVKVRTTGMKFAMHYFSYEDPDAVKLEKGGAAQIAFVPSDSPEALSPSQ